MKIIKLTIISDITANPTRASLFSFEDSIEKPMYANLFNKLLFAV